MSVTVLSSERRPPAIPSSESSKKQERNTLSKFVGYVVMPDHVHLLLSEPVGHKLSTAIQVIKQRFSRTRTEEYVWESRYYDHNVLTHPHFVEKLRYIHLNPVRRCLVDKPGDWKWSSYRFYQANEPGPVVITRGWASTLDPTLPR